MPTFSAAFLDGAFGAAAIEIFGVVRHQRGAIGGIAYVGAGAGCLLVPSISGGEIGQRIAAHGTAQQAW